MAKEKTRNKLLKLAVLAREIQENTQKQITINVPADHFLCGCIGDDGFLDLEKKGVLASLCYELAGYKQLFTPCKYCRFPIQISTGFPSDYKIIDGKKWGPPYYRFNCPNCNRNFERNKDEC